MPGSATDEEHDEGGMTNDQHRHVVGYTLLAFGGLLIVVGIGLTIYQFIIVASTPMPSFPVRSLAAGTGGVTAKTTYVGVILVVAGLASAISGAWMFRNR